MDTPSSSSNVTFREVTDDTVRDVCNLSVRDDQKGLVAPNAVSIAEAYFAKHAWFRAIYAADTLVGFLMLWDKPEEHEYGVWRLMVDARGRSDVSILLRRSHRALAAHR